MSAASREDQQVERLLCKQMVASSIPALDSTSQAEPEVFTALLIRFSGQPAF